MKIDYKQIGIVIWFKSKKGYGFIKPSDPSEKEDVFVHWSGIDMEGYRVLKEGQKVEYALKDSPKGIVAVEVKVVE